METEGGSSRQLVLALPGALAASSLAQDTREARGTVAPLMVVARAAVLTAQHRVVAHPSCEDRQRRRGEKKNISEREEKKRAEAEERRRQAGVINRSLRDRGDREHQQASSQGTSCLFSSCLHRSVS